MKHIITKDQLAGVISSKTGFAKKDVEQIITELISRIKAEMVSGNCIRFNGFGVFDAKLRRQKIGNDITREKSVIIPAHRVPVFRASQNFKKKIK